MLPSVYNCAKCLGVISPEPSLRNDAFDGGGDATGQVCMEPLKFPRGRYCQCAGESWMPYLSIQAAETPLFPGSVFGSVNYAMRVRGVAGSGTRIHISFFLYMGLGDWSNEIGPSKMRSSIPVVEPPVLQSLT